MNGSSVSTAGDLFVDARPAVSGCAAIALQQMTVNLRGDLTLVVGKFDALNGIHIVSADGLPHVVTVRVEGPSGSVNTDVTLQAAAVDSNIRVIATSGTVAIG